MMKLKHYYQNIGENWFSYSGFYADMVERLPSGAKIAEIGCWKGRSTACLGVEIHNSDKNIHLFCIDSWKYTPNTEQPLSSQEEFDEILTEFLQNIMSVQDHIAVIRKDSITASGIFQDNYFDFIFIDANHTYKSVKKDIESWYPKLKTGGIIAGHDYFTSVHPGVKEAVDEIFPDAKFIPEQNVWYTEK